MNAARERKIIRWIHIVGSIPILGLIYGPVSKFPNAVLAIQWVFFPLIALSGLWLWKGHMVKKWFRKHKKSRGLRTVSISRWHKTFPQSSQRNTHKDHN